MQHLTRAAFAALLSTVLGAALAQPEVGTPPLGHSVRITPTSSDKQVVANVYSGRYSWVRIETRENGAALNEHPAVLTPAEVRGRLEQVLWVEPPNERLFSARQLDEISAPVAAALGRANAGQDVSFAVSDQFGFFGALAARAVTTARVFMHDGQLQVIVGLARRNFESQFRGTGTLIAFEPGQRAQAVDREARLAVASGSSRQLRGDWFALGVGGEPAPGARAAAAAPPAAAATTTPAPTTPASTTPAPTTPASTTPASTTPAPASKAPPTAVPAPAAKSADELYRGVAERLRALDRLRSDGLITEAEYQEKRRQLLRDL